MEATGVYSLPLALALNSAPNIEIRVVNPKAIKNFATAIMQRGKTDSMDAATILDFLERMPFQPWHAPSSELLELQHICRRVVQLNGEVSREHNRHLAALRVGPHGRIVANDTLVNVKHLQRRIARLEHAALDLINHVPALADKLATITSATGIARKTGPRILAELLVLPDDMLAPQWVAHAGLDPKPHQSGTSTNKPARISKAGNRYLRDALYFPALVASRRDPNVKAYYEKLIARGKKPMQALVAIMRKLLLAIWGMLNSGQPWDGNKFYKMA